MTRRGLRISPLLHSSSYWQWEVDQRSQLLRTGNASLWISPMFLGMALPHSVLPLIWTTISPFGFVGYNVSSFWKPSHTQPQINQTEKRHIYIINVYIPTSLCISKSLAFFSLSLEWQAPIPIPISLPLSVPSWLADDLDDKLDKLLVGKDPAITPPQYSSRRICAGFKYLELFRMVA